MNVRNVRHFAYYRQADGGYVRELLVPASPPARWAWLRPFRGRRFARWSNDLARPAAGEIALDVSRFDYPLGDFCWSVLRFGDGDDGKPLLDFPVQRTFMQLDRATMEIVAWVRSPRPVRSTAWLLVLDVTGTAWESVYGAFGQFGAYPGGAYVFAPNRVVTSARLAAAAESLSPYVLAPEHVMAMEV